MGSKEGLQRNKISKSCGFFIKMSLFNFCLLVVLISNVEITLTNNISTSACVGTWYEIPSRGCFLFYTGSKSWYDAHSYCEDNNGYLAEITDEGLHAAVSLWVKLINGSSWTWVGGNDIAIEGQWKWLHSDVNITETFWTDGHPVTDNYINCLEFNPSNYPDSWFDMDCDNLRPFICQKPLNS